MVLESAVAGSICGRVKGEGGRGKGVDYWDVLGLISF